MSVDSSSEARSRYLRIQFLIALSGGVLTFFLLWWDLDSLFNGAIIGIISILEIFVGGRMLYSVFQYYQPKRTISFNPILTLVLLSLIVGHLTHYLTFLFADLEGVESRYLSPEIHISYLFFVFWILYYEWWFLKNELIGNQSTQRLLTLKEDLKNAEIRVIQQNVQPHFLFNSLNSINSLIIADPDHAQEMVVRLSEFLRHSVIKNQKMFVSLKDEIDQINRYFAIEKIRFSSRLEYVLEHDEDIEDVEIPSMILQPLVENAIKHGLYGQVDRTEIKMSFKKEEGYLVFNMTNPFDPVALKKKGAGFGLDSIRKKLYLLYAENELLNAVARDKIYYTTLKIPLNHESIDR
mgnify:CR=1 FL=1